MNKKAKELFIQREGQINDKNFINKEGGIFLEKTEISPVSNNPENIKKERTLQLADKKNYVPSDDDSLLIKKTDLSEIFLKDEIDCLTNRKLLKDWLMVNRGTNYYYTFKNTNICYNSKAEYYNKLPINKIDTEIITSPSNKITLKEKIKSLFRQSF